MKILYVITGLGQGGAERVVCDLADSMYEQGCEVKIAYLTGNILTRPFHEEIEIIELGLKNFSTIFRAYRSLLNLIKLYNPDIVHSHMIHANLLTRIIRLTTPIKKLICTAHSANEGGIIRMVLYRITHNLSDVTTNVSEYASNVFIQKKAVHKSDIITVYNGINIENFKYFETAKKSIALELNIKDDTKIILAVGRFHKAKNYPNLIQAIKKLNVYYHNFVLIIAGDGELRPILEQQIKDLCLEQKIILVGRRNDVPKLMSAADVFVLSSDYEGLPTVLIEAMACEAHVVSTDVSGAREIINKYGRIVPCNNSTALCDGVVEALKLTNKNKDGAEYIRSKFNLDIISKQWLDIYLNENF